MEIINLNANNDDQERKNDTAMEVPIEENRVQDDSNSDISDESTNKSTQEEQDYGIVFQTKIFERLQKIDSKISLKSTLPGPPAPPAPPYADPVVLPAPG